MSGRSQLWFCGLLTAGILLLVGFFMLPVGETVANFMDSFEVFYEDIRRPAPQVTKEISDAGRLALMRWKQAKYFELCELARSISDGRALNGLTNTKAVIILFMIESLVDPWRHLSAATD